MSTQMNWTQKSAVLAPKLKKVLSWTWTRNLTQKLNSILPSRDSTSKKQSLTCMTCSAISISTVSTGKSLMKSRYSQRSLNSSTSPCQRSTTQKTRCSNWSSALTFQSMAVLLESGLDKINSKPNLRLISTHWMECAMGCTNSGYRNSRQWSPQMFR